MVYKISITWDDEAQVWIAVSEDLKGLVLECGSLDALIERVRISVPELLEIQGDPRKDITFRGNALIRSYNKQHKTRGIISFFPAEK